MQNYINQIVIYISFLYNSEQYRQLQRYISQFAPKIRGTVLNFDRFGEGLPFFSMSSSRKQGKMENQLFLNVYKKCYKPLKIESKQVQNFHWTTGPLKALSRNMNTIKATELLFQSRKKSYFEYYYSEIYIFEIRTFILWSFLF